MKACVLVLLACLGGAAAGMPDCSAQKCPSTCSCVEQKCGASVYAECAADSQCDGMMTCLLGCSCNDVMCALGCVAGKTLDSVSEKVKSCGSSCASTLTCDHKAFSDYKARFGKTYANSTEEHERGGLFAASCKHINELNEMNGDPAFGLSHLTDRRPSEMPKRGRKGKGDTRFVHSAPVLQVASPMSPASIDWRLTPAVTAVKNQGQCGSCWAFSVAETVESHYVLDVDDKFRETFSPQQIASCTTECYGCGGGDTVTGYQYLMKDAPGLASNYFWPYVQGPLPADNCEGPSCTESCSTHNISVIDTVDGKFYIGPYAKITGFKYATPPCTSACQKQDLQTLAASLEHGPISVCVNAGAWDSYVGGVLTSKACGSMSYDDQDHCVQLVGFNTTAPTPYWIVRNSWATSWGMEGYIHLEMAKNTCGLADEATIPTVGNAVADKRAAMLRQAARGQRSVVV